MKLSKAMHVLNVLVGFAGVVTAIVAVLFWPSHAHGHLACD
jgi:hypothetical protein